MTEQDITRLLEEEGRRADEDRDVERHYVRSRAPESPSQVYSLRIPVERLEQLRQLADQRAEAPSAMLRRWVVERLDQELARAIRQTPVARFDELFDPRSVRELEQLLQSLAASRDLVVRDALAETLRQLHRQLYSTLEAFAEIAAGHDFPRGPEDEAPRAS